MSEENPRWSSKFYRIGYLFAAAVFIFCLWVAFHYGPQQRWLRLMLCVSGVVIGWAGGVVISPMDDSEKSLFNKLGAGVAAMFTALVTVLGTWLLTNIGPGVAQKLNDQISNAPEHIFIWVLLFVTTVLIGGLCTSIHRMYGESRRERQKRQLAAMTPQVKELLEKVTRLTDELEG